MYEFIKIDSERRLVGAVAYRVGEIDKQGDYVATEEDLFEGMETFAKNGFVCGLQHESEAPAFIVESFLTESEVLKGGKLIPEGSWWVCMKITDDALWKRIREGDFTGFSMSGKADAQIE